MSAYCIFLEWLCSLWLTDSSLRSTTLSVWLITVTPMFAQLIPGYKITQETPSWLRLHRYFQRSLTEEGRHPECKWHPSHRLESEWKRQQRKIAEHQHSFLAAPWSTQRKQLPVPATTPSPSWWIVSFSNCKPVPSSQYVVIATREPSRTDRLSQDTQERRWNREWAKQSSL